MQFAVYIYVDIEKLEWNFYIGLFINTLCYSVVNIFFLFISKIYTNNYTIEGWLDTPPRDALGPGFSLFHERVHHCGSGVKRGSIRVDF